MTSNKELNYLSQCFQDDVRLLSLKVGKRVKKIRDNGNILSEQEKLGRYKEFIETLKTLYTKVNRNRLPNAGLPTTKQNIKKESKDAKPKTFNTLYSDSHQLKVAVPKREICKLDKAEISSGLYDSGFSESTSKRSVETYGRERRSSPDRRSPDRKTRKSPIRRRSSRSPNFRRRNSSSPNFRRRNSSRSPRRDHESAEISFKRSASPSRRSKATGFSGLGTFPHKVHQSVKDRINDYSSKDSGYSSNGRKSRYQNNKRSGLSIEEFREKMRGELDKEVYGAWMPESGWKLVENKDYPRCQYIVQTTRKDERERVNRLYENVIVNGREKVRNRRIHEYPELLIDYKHGLEDKTILFPDAGVLVGSLYPKICGRTKVAARFGHIRHITNLKGEPVLTKTDDRFLYPVYDEYKRRERIDKVRDYELYCRNRRDNDLYPRLLREAREADRFLEERGVIDRIFFHCNEINGSEAKNQEYNVIIGTRVRFHIALSQQDRPEAYEIILVQEVESVKKIRREKEIAMDAIIDARKVELVDIPSDETPKASYPTFDPGTEEADPSIGPSTTKPTNGKSKHASKFDYNLNYTSKNVASTSDENGDAMIGYATKQ